MSDNRITQNKAKNNPDLQSEVNAFNPYHTSTPRKSSVIIHKDIESSNQGSEISIELESTLGFENTVAKNPKSNLTPHIKSLPKTINMAVPVNQTVSLQDAIKVVPEFDGANISLGQFLEGCTEAKDMIEEGAERNLVKLICSKMFGEARSAIVGQTFNTIDGLKNFFRSIYFPVKSVQQLIGELGREYQREGESVISFTNRLRDIGRKILETKKLSGELNQSFKDTNNKNIMECFLQGLLPSISQRLRMQDSLNEMITEAIQIEKQLEAQAALRHSRFNIARTKAIQICQLCKKEGHEADTCKTNRSNVCEICKKPSHCSDRCFFKDKSNHFQKTHQICQLCDKPGHVASSCRLVTKCQICQRIGHGAKDCRNNAAPI